MRLPLRRSQTVRMFPSHAIIARCPSGVMHISFTLPIWVGQEFSNSPLCSSHIHSILYSADTIRSPFGVVRTTLTPPGTFKERTSGPSGRVSVGVMGYNPAPVAQPRACASRGSISGHEKDGQRPQTCGFNCLASLSRVLADSRRMS